MPEQQHPVLQALADAHSSARSQFDQVDLTKQMLDHVKGSLDKLVQLGDMVTPEDVIEEAGRLVARGAPAGQMAALLADMPDAGGPALQGWLAQHEQMVAQKEAQLMPVHGLLGHRAAVAGLQLLAGHSAMSQMPQMVAQAQQPPGPQQDTSAAPAPNSLGA